MMIFWHSGQMMLMMIALRVMVVRDAAFGSPLPPSYIIFLALGTIQSLLVTM